MPSVLAAPKVEIYAVGVDLHNILGLVRDPHIAGLTRNPM
jgi:hypothetical protein